MNILWVFPMAGRGTRTKEMGEFKPFININGVKMVRWFLRSIKSNFEPDDQLCFITRRLYYEEYGFESEINELLISEKIENQYYCEYANDQDCDLGQAMTVYHAKDKIRTAEKIIVANCDQYILFDIPPALNGNLSFMTVNLDLGNSKSFVKIENKLITEIREKENISNIASTGIYSIQHGDLFVWALEKMFKDKITINGEFYVSPSLNYLIKNKNYHFHPIVTSIRFDLGTIHGIKNFQKTLADL